MAKMLKMLNSFGRQQAPHVAVPQAKLGHNKSFHESDVDDLIANEVSDFEDEEDDHDLHADSKYDPDHAGGVPVYKASNRREPQFAAVDVEGRGGSMPAHLMPGGRPGSVLAGQQGSQFMLDPSGDDLWKGSSEAALRQMERERKANRNKALKQAKDMNRQLRGTEIRVKTNQDLDPQAASPLLLARANHAGSNGSFTQARARPSALEGSALAAQSAGSFSAQRSRASYAGPALDVSSQPSGHLLPDITSPGTPGAGSAEGDSVLPRIDSRESMARKKENQIMMQSLMQSQPAGLGAYGINKSKRMTTNDVAKAQMGLGSGGSFSVQRSGNSVLSPGAFGGTAGRPTHSILATTQASSQHKELHPLAGFLAGLVPNSMLVMDDGQPAAPPAGADPTPPTPTPKAAPARESQGRKKLIIGTTAAGAHSGIDVGFLSRNPKYQSAGAEDADDKF